MDIVKELINLDTKQLNKLIEKWTIFEVNIIENKDNQFKIILRGIKMKQLVKKNTNSEVVNILLEMKSDMVEMKSNVLEMKSDMVRMESKIDSNFIELKKDVVDIKEDIIEMKEDIAEIKSLPTIKKESAFFNFEKINRDN